MIQTLKNIILLSLCASFCAAVSQDNTTNLQNNETESKNSNLQIPANSDKITTLSQNANLQNDKKIAKNAEFESIKTLEFPKDEAEEKQLNELFMAIESLDSDKIQKLVKQNPRLVNLQNSNLDDERYFVPLYNAVLAYGEADSDKKREIALKNVKILLDNKADVNVCVKNRQEQFSLITQIAILSLFYNNIEIFEFLINNGNLNINHTCNHLQLLAFLFVTKEQESRFKLFNFLVQQKAEAKNALYAIVVNEMGTKADKMMEKNKFDDMFLYIQSDEYKQRRDKAKRYIFEILTNYSVNDFDINELQIVGMYFVFTKDIEFINLMIDNGYLKNKELNKYMLDIANKIENKEIIELLQGVNYE